MIVVADTSPILYGHAIGLLHLFPAVFREILVPPFVAVELARGQPHLVIDVRDYPWIVVRPPIRDVASMVWKIELDEGEVEAIALALDLDAAYILIDDGDARKEAERLGLTVTGLLGVLRLAKLQGHIPCVLDPLRELLTKTNFRVSREVVDRFLASCGEGPLSL